MKNNTVIILAPGKCGSTYLANKIQNSIVVHDPFYGRNALICLINGISFWVKVLIFKPIVILPYRDDKSRKVSLFWNHFESNLYNYSKYYKDRYRTFRYKSISNFLADVFDHTEYETYGEWYRRLWIDKLIGIKSNASHVAKYGVHFYTTHFDHFEILFESLAANGVVITNNTKINSKNEFWHSILHKELENAKK